ncbi:unnamed protein product [Sphagnum troendelagicum]|uniref:Uncharacterized protein n=1 Tax=Sphagnum troendelagicum TaxID=128251 RepID=A0ABP0UI67_9BRYO
MKAKKKRGVQAVSYGFAFSFVSAHVLGGGGLVRVGTAAAAATGSKSFLELSVVVDSPKFRLTAAATPPTDPGDGDFKASRHSSSTGSATLVVDLGSLQIMVWPALSATPWSQLELPKDPSKSARRIS